MENFKFQINFEFSCCHSMVDRWSGTSWNGNICIRPRSPRWSLSQSCHKWSKMISSIRISRSLMTSPAKNRPKSAKLRQKLSHLMRSRLFYISLASIYLINKKTPIRRLQANIQRPSNEITCSIISLRNFKGISEHMACATARI